jgi:NADH-quinone oxidoreductase subunit J
VLLEQILFFVAAAGAIAGALGVVVLRNPFFSVLALVEHLISLALLFLLLRAEFIAAAQVVIYAGAVMVLYIFVVAYVGGVEETVGGEGAIVGSALPAIDSRGTHVAAGFGSPGAIGKLLLEKFMIVFEASTFLLLFAIIGAVVLSRRRRGLEDLPGDELPERAGPAPLGDPSGEADVDDGEEPPPGTAEGAGDPTPEREAELLGQEDDGGREPEPEPVTEPAQ